MARKYELISELYDRTCKTVVSNPQSWQKFLESACRNYKLRFDEQLLIFAQRPDATAVLEIERWNTSFGRWVNKGAKGIAVFEDANRSRQRLTHYFDISDTHESRYSRPVPLWNMRDEYDASVIETLENTFGELENKSSLSNAVMSAAQNAAEDNLTDYLNDLVYISEDSFLEELSEDMIASLYKKVVTNSVAYMMMSRLGINAEEYFEADDFRDVTNFNTQDTLNALGIATSDIAEMGLSEISKTVMALDRENRIIDEQRQFDYNKDNKDERSQNNERNHIHDGGRLQSSELDSARTVGSDSRQMVEDEENLSERTSQNPVLQSADERDTYSALGGSSAESNRVGGNLGQTDGTERGTDRADESERYDEMGSPNEQYQELGTGNREGTGNIQLVYYDREHEDKSLPFFGGDDTIREILGTTPHLSASKEEIKDFFERNTSNSDRTEYVKSIFNNDYPKVIEIGDTLEAMQAIVEGDIEEYMPFADDVAIICNEEGKMNGMQLNRAIYSEPENVEMSYQQLKAHLRQAEKERNHTAGYVVFTADSFDKPYTEEERTYVVGSNNKAFIEGMGGYSIYASSLDGSDKNVRLEAYMADEYGGKDGWKIEKCYVKDESNREILDIIAGKFFIAYAPIESEKLLSMPKDLMKKYEDKFKYPEHFYQTDNGIVAKAYKPLSKDMER